MTAYRFRPAALVLAFLAVTGQSEAATRARAMTDALLADPPTRLASGAFHTCQVLDDGRVRCWGSNGSGQLGEAATSGTSRGTPTLPPTFRSSPVFVSGLTGAVAVAAGLNHTCALIADGTVRCWGSNSRGQLGDGTTTQRRTPVAVVGLTRAVAITTGSAHTCALVADGTMRCWGANVSGQLGDGTLTDRLTPSPVIQITGIRAIAAGASHTCALRFGNAFCWGFNGAGRLGNGTTTSSPTRVLVPGILNATAITAGEAHTCVLLADGTARCWGLGDTGQLGDGTGTGRLTPVPVSGLAGASSIEAGALHTCALLADGTERCWGSNTQGQLGDGSTATLRLAPVAVTALANAVAVSSGTAHTCAVGADGGPRCWGMNGSGQLGNGTLVSSLVPIAVSGGGGFLTARDIAAGTNHTCAVRGNGNMSCWGDNTYGELGDGTFTSRLLPTSVAGPVNTVAMATGIAHTCALLADGTVRCWGLNNQGQLGDGTVGTNRSTGVLVSGLTGAVGIVAGGEHTCALLVNGTMRCWGQNAGGQLGDGTFTRSAVPVPVKFLTDLISIAAGVDYSCAVNVNGTGFCWGRNDSGQLGDTTVNAGRPNPSAVAGSLPYITIGAGSRSACGLTSDGVVKCWGGNDSGQLGDGTTTPRPRPDSVVNLSFVSAITVGDGHACALGADGLVRCWGDNRLGQIGITPPGTFQSQFHASPRTLALSLVSQLAAGTAHTCSIFAAGGVACWGSNQFGQIGDGTRVARLAPVPVPSFDFNIDPRVLLADRDRVTTVTILAACEEDQWLHVDVVLEQGTITGRGTAAGKCAGGLERYPVRVATHGANVAFVEGSAFVEARAVVRGRGGFVEEHEWTRRVEIVAPEEEE